RPLVAGDLLRGEVRDRVAALECLTQLVPPGAVELLEAEERALEHRPEIVQRAAGEVVDADDADTLLEDEPTAQVRSDETGRACNPHLSDVHLSLLVQTSIVGDVAASLTVAIRV